MKGKKIKAILEDVVVGMIISSSSSSWSRSPWDVAAERLTTENGFVIVLNIL